MLRFFHKEHVSISSLFGSNVNLKKTDEEYARSKLESLVKQANVSNPALNKIEALYVHDDKIAIRVQHIDKPKNAPQPQNVFIADFNVEPALIAKLVDFKHKKYNRDILKQVVDSMAADNNKLRVGFSVNQKNTSQAIHTIDFKKFADEAREFYLRVREQALGSRQNVLSMR